MRISLQTGARIGARCIALALMMTALGCATTDRQSAEVLELRSPDGELYQRIVHLDGCRFRVLSGTPHETTAMDVTRERVGEYVRWPYGGFTGAGPVYFPVPYDGRRQWQVEGVVFESQPLDGSATGLGETVYAVRAQGWPADELHPLFSKQGDYLGMYSARLGVFGIAAPRDAERFYRHCRL